jgi:signal transduction histidine kinase
LTGSPTIPNPLGSVAVVDMENGAPGLIWLIGLGVLVGAMAAPVVRMRRATGELRQQLRWLAFAAVLTAVALVAFVGAYAVFGAAVPELVFNAVLIVGFGIAVPVSCGIAILKHGLYEIDVVIRRTVVYAAIAAFTTGVYLAVVLGAGAVVGRDSSFLTMLAAVVVAVSFQPVYRRASRFADRVAYGERATPYEVLSEFSERLGGTYASDDLMSRMARIVAEGTGAEAADVWLKIGDELRIAASWPATDRRVDAIAVSNGALPDLPECDRAFPVEQAGELLGALSVRKPPADPLRPAEEKLVSDLASQAGLVLRNERLTTELRARLDDLRAAQKRIVAAQDEERRRLERNIHDGAQQQLVAIAVRMRLAQGLVERDPAAAAGVLEQLQRETQGALETLRDLARGIYPPLLADRGLVAALTAQAQKAPIDVDVDADGVGRYAQDVEAAAYFCCLEALQNVAKYAEAPRASVRVRGDHASLEFVVADRGVGFDPSVASAGSGLQGMADRLAALDGTLQVSSSPGAGTVVTGRIPAASAVERGSA